MRKFPLFPKFFVDRVQLIFALVLVSIVFVIAYLATTQSHQSSVPKSPDVTPNRSETQVSQEVISINPSSETQISQEVIPTEQISKLKIQPTKAVALVDNLKEVQDAKSTATANNNKFVTEVDSYPTSQNNFYVVHAYEIVPNGDGTGHTATVGWYNVNPQTGTVTNIDSSP